MDKKDKEKENQNQYVGAYTNHYCEGTKRARQAADALLEGQKEMMELVSRRTNCTPEQTGGFGAEIWHKSHFKADAAQKGRVNLDVKIGPRGGRGAKGSSDLTVIENGNTVAEAGIKFRSKPTKTALDHTNQFDSGRQKISPSEQVERVRELASKRAETGTLKAKEYADTAKNATDKLTYENVSSKPLSKEEAVKLVENPGRLGKEAFVMELSQATKNGAYIGAAIQGGVSLITNTKACLKDEKDIEDAIIAVGKDIVTGGIQGAAIGAGSTVARQGLIKAGAVNLAKGSAPVVIAASALEAGCNIAGDIGDYIGGDINGGELIGRAVGHTCKAAVKGGSSWAGAEAGAALGSLLGPVGTLGGAVLGGLFGYMFGSGLVD